MFTRFSERNAKMLIMSAVYIAAFLWVWLASYHIFLLRQIDGMHFIVLGVSVALLLLLFCVVAFIIEQKRYFLSILFLGFASGIIFFTTNIFFAIAALIGLIFASISHVRIQQDRHLVIKLKLKRIISLHTGGIIFTISLFLSLLYYGHPLIDLSRDSISIPEPVGHFLLSRSGGLLKNVFPFYNPNMTIDELIIMTAAEQTKGIDINELMKQLPSDMIEGAEGFSLDEISPDMISKFLSQSGIGKSELASARAELSKTFGTEIRGDERVGDLVLTLVNKKLREVTYKYKDILLPFIMITVFFVVNLILKIVMPFILFFAQLVFKLLFAIKFLKLEIVSVPKETITL